MPPMVSFSHKSHSLYTLLDVKQLHLRRRCHHPSVVHACFAKKTLSLSFTATSNFFFYTLPDLPTYMLRAKHATLHGIIGAANCFKGVTDGKNNNHTESKTLPPSLRSLHPISSLAAVG